MARIVSFVVLVAILLVIAGLFYQVIANFLLPLFLALLLVVMFGPLHRWVLVKCKGRVRLAAGLTTASILLIFLIPLLLILVQAASEGITVYNAIVETVGEENRAVADLPDGEPNDKRPTVLKLRNALAQRIVKTFERVGLELSVEKVEATITERAQVWLTPLLFSTPGYLGRTLLGLVVMVISLYYFLADGPAMIRTLMRLSPLDDKYEEQLIARFDNVTRAVVVATLLSAFVQGILAGFGYLVAGLDAVFLLIVLTMLLAMVPFVGAAAVWIPASLWLFYSGHTGTAVALAIYGAAIVSTADNFIKPIILHGRSNLHPLLALLSVLGGVQALGPIGIFVGPMVVAFLQTLLNMLHTELNSLGKAVVVKQSES